MKELMLTLLVLLLTSTFTSAQTWTQASTGPEYIQYNPSDWGDDIKISNSEPFGKITGVAKTNGTIYIAIADTAIQAGKSIVIFRTTNYGTNWTNFLSYTGTVLPQRSKMVRTGLDSVYYFYLYNSIIYCLNVENNNFNSITTTQYRDFDVVGSSTGGLYVVADALTSTSIPRYSSANGFTTISQTGSVSTGAFPRMYMSGSGDTLILTFYGSTLTSDTISSNIRQGRYRETAPGTISSAGFQDVVTESGPKSEVQPVMYNGVVWFIYAYGTTGSIDIKYMLSTNSGANYTGPNILAGNVNTDEYWFEARHYKTGTGGLDIAYYSDSLQAGLPTNYTDKMLYRYSNATTPGTISPPVQFSQHIPGWSARMYIPAMVEIYNTSDVGVAWVGLEGTNKRVWWDRYTVVSRVTGNENEVPDNYALSQNYPNPFNPVTKIDFVLKKSGFVSLKVYDFIGREISEIVSKEMDKGGHSVTFDASGLSSGVYFYRLEVNGFTQTKKMTFVK